MVRRFPGNWRSASRRCWPELAGRATAASRTASSGGMFAPTPRGQKPVVAQVQLTQGLRPVGRFMGKDSGKEHQAPDGGHIDQRDEHCRTADVLGPLGQVMMFQGNPIHRSLKA